MCTAIEHQASTLDGPIPLSTSGMAAPLHAPSGDETDGGLQSADEGMKTF